MTPTHTYIDRPCTRIRKNSDGTSLVSFPLVAEGDGLSNPEAADKLTITCDQRTVSNRFLTSIQPKPKQPRLLSVDPHDRMKFESFNGYVLSLSNPLHK